MFTAHDAGHQGITHNFIADQSANALAPSTVLIHYRRCFLVCHRSSASSISFYVLLTDITPSEKLISHAELHPWLPNMTSQVSRQQSRLCDGINPALGCTAWRRSVGCQMRLPPCGTRHTSRIGVGYHSHPISDALVQHKSCLHERRGRVV